MSFPIFGEIKDPDAVLDYFYDWTGWLSGDTIIASTWIVPTGLTKESESNTATGATIWVSGGTAGTNYPVTNRISTAAGRTEDRTSVIKCKDR
jgi:hypothetical protein